MKKRIKSVILIIVLQLIFTGCGQTENEKTPIQNNGANSPSVTETATPDETTTSQI